MSFGSRNINFAIYLLSGSLNGNKEHQPGNYAYPFSIQLPGSLPSSFEGSHGYVRYVCQCTIDRPWRVDAHIKREFTLIQHLDLNHLSEAPVSISFSIFFTSLLRCPLVSPVMMEGPQLLHSHLKSVLNYATIKFISL